jgi:dTDP-4-amino-4,6-dideoxygalactose transaminase
MNVIPFFGLDRQYKILREEILDTTDRVYSSGKVLDGHYTKEFERQIAYKCQRSYAITVNSGTQGLIFAQQAVMRKPPYSVLIPTVSFAATINSVLMNAFTPVFCDIDYKGLIDLGSLEYQLDDNIGAVMYVNLFGNTVDWNKFQIQTQFFNSNVKIIEDAAQSFGASFNGVPSGKMGDVSVLSFDPTKNLPNYGSGGMILTDDYTIWEACKNLKNNGKSSDHDIPGTNSKMSEVDCAQMLVKLKHFDAWQCRRADIAEYYTKELHPYVDILIPNSGTTHSWHKYVIRTGNRNGLLNYLHKNNIETRIHYDVPLYEYGVGMGYIDYAKQLFTETSAFTRECLSLPIYPELEDYEVEQVVGIIKQYYIDQT